MQIAKNRVAFIDYTLSSNDGEVLDSSSGGEPLAYLHGAENIIPGLENALEGKAVGDNIKVKVSAEEGYGTRIEEMVQDVPRELLANIDNIEVGMQLQAETDAGIQVVTISAVSDESVTVDGNHPLAGMELNFDVTVRDIREATDEELEHGHVHSPDGCGH